MKSRMTVWLIKRKGNASIWRNLDFVHDENGAMRFLAFRTRREAVRECERIRAMYGTEWEVIKLTEAK
jgi:hypothetical protein